MSMFKILQIIGMLYVLSFGMMYFFSAKRGKPIVLPGDILIRKAGSNGIYLPIASALYISILLYFLFDYLAKGISPGTSA